MAKELSTVGAKLRRDPTWMPIAPSEWSTISAPKRLRPMKSSGKKPTFLLRAPWEASSTTKRFPSSRSRSSPARPTTNSRAERHGDELEKRNILYAPDYVANAGGVINVYRELAGWDSQRSLRKADEIYDTILSVFAIAKADKVPSYIAADRLAERRLKAVGSLMRTWPLWPNQ